MFALYLITLLSDAKLIFFAKNFLGKSTVLYQPMPYQKKYLCVLLAVINAEITRAINLELLFIYFFSPCNKL